MFTSKRGEKMNGAQRRYMWRFLPAMVVYSLVIPVSSSLIDGHRVDGVTLIALSIAPALPLLVAIAAVGLYLIEETDEYVRMRAIIGALGGTGLVLAFGTVWGFLEQGGVVAHIPAWFVFPLWAIGLGLSQGLCGLINRWGSRP
ncbi:hypothetical protein GGQ80_002861 [Sphingomonas jinjuensis]|uniref:Uncharacterized protein n=1 Tax=Sphingomonas jinjuensis TaxID=535907 RepID=A0A840FNT1_9SPHN|nr:hypothetical protein [Sphingomonas jinjuensis]MBB4154945.1 hypothetical protein [Sphingomonas jinjuensis]